MYCPNCAAPIDGVKFCRTCGANVSLVPQALTGQLPAPDSPDAIEPERSGRRGGRHAQRSEKPASIDKAATKFVTGLGFLVAALVVTLRFPGGFTWGWTFLFPAFALMGDGIGQYLKVQEQRRQWTLNQSPNYSLNNPAQHAGNYQYLPGSSAPAPVISAPTTSELRLSPSSPASPPSVIEHTTKHLDAARPREEQ